MPSAEFLNDLVGDLLGIIAACRPTAEDVYKNGTTHDDINTDLLMEKLVIYISDRDSKIVNHARGAERAQP